MLLQCSSCGAALPDRGAYCPQCASQVRCKNCDDLLLSQARACVTCGTFLGEGAEIFRREEGNGSTPHVLNTITYEETKSMRKFEARFSDAAVGSLSEPLQGVLSHRIGQQLAPPMLSGILQETSSPVRQLALDNADTDPGAIETTGKIKDDSIATVEDPVSTDLARLHEVFSVDEDRVRLDLTQLKGSSKQDDVRRLAYLFLYVKELLGTKLVSKSLVIEVIKEAGRYSSNSHKVFDYLDDLSVEGDQVRLRTPGRQKAREYLNEVLDPNIPSGTTRSVNTRGKSRSSSTTDAESGRRSGRSKVGLESDTVKPWVEAWKGSDQPFDGHSLLANRSLADKGLVALWAIKQIAAKDVKMVSARFLSQFLHSAFEHMENPRNLDRALKKENGKTVINTTGTQFQINGTGVKYVEDLIKVSKAEGTSDEASG